MHVYTHTSHVVYLQSASVYI